MDELRDESIERVLTACPGLEDAIVACVECCDARLGDPPRAKVNQYLMSRVTGDAQDDIIEMTRSAKVADASGLQGAALLAALMDGNQFFGARERALIGAPPVQ